MQARLFALAYCMIFFNPFSLTNEIWPFYLAFTLSWTYRYEYLVLLALFSFLSVIAGIIRFYIPIIDVLQGAIVFQTFFYVSRLNERDKKVIGDIFVKFLFASILFGVAQFSLPNLQDTTYSLFSGRPSLAEHLIDERKVVTLFSPEPAYAAAHLTSMFLFLMYIRKNTFIATIFFIVSVLLTRSISTVAILPLILIFGLFSNRISYRSTVIGLLSILSFLFIFQGQFAAYFYRLIQFAQLVIENGSLLRSEEELGSTRLQQSYSTVFSFFNDYYTKPYSFIGLINEVTYSLFPIFLLPLTIFCFVRAPIVTLFATAILILSGPVLLSLSAGSVVLIVLELTKKKYYSSDARKAKNDNYI